MRTLAILLLTSVQGACLISETDPLTIEIDRPDRVAGSYMHRDELIEFDITRGPIAHTTRFIREDGSPIVVIEVAGNRQRLTVLDGELIVDGVLGSPDPAVHGDLFAMRKLEARRELLAIDRVYEQLEQAGVDASLFTPTAPPPGAPRVLAHGETAYWWSTFGPASRTFELVNTTPTCAAIAIGSLPGGPEVAIVTGAQSFTRYGWSGLIAIENLGEWTAWDDPVCGVSPVQVRVVP